MAIASEPLPTDARRVHAFVQFFKSYMNVFSVAVAAVPAPVTALGALPTFADHKTTLAIYTSLFCFLTLGLIFFVRHGLARWMFLSQSTPGEDSSAEGRDAVRARHRRPRCSALKVTVAGCLPVACIALAGTFAWLYHSHLDRAIYEIARYAAVPVGTVACGDLDPVRLARECSVPTAASVLAGSYLVIPSGFWLRPLYIGMWIAAEAAFILMATREYIQDLLQLSDTQVIRQTY